MAQNWLRMAAAAPLQGAPGDYLARLNGDGARVGALQAAYLDKQVRLWQALAEGRKEAAVRAEHGDAGRSGDQAGRVSRRRTSGIRRSVLDW